MSPAWLCRAVSISLRRREHVEHAGGPASCVTCARCVEGQSVSVSVRTSVMVFAVNRGSRWGLLPGPQRLGGRKMSPLRTSLPVTWLQVIRAHGVPKGEACLSWRGGLFSPFVVTTWGLSVR